MLGSAAALLGAFVLTERRAPRPLLDPELLIKPSTAVASAAILAIGISMFATVTFLPLCIQNTLRHSALGTGFASSC